MTDLNIQSYKFKDPTVIASQYSDGPLPPDFKDWPAVNQDQVLGALAVKSLQDGTTYEVFRTECIPDPEGPRPPHNSRWLVTIEARAGLKLVKS